jgi:hypothetical protein
MAAGFANRCVWPVRSQASMRSSRQPGRPVVKRPDLLTDDPNAASRTRAGAEPQGPPAAGAHRAANALQMAASLLRAQARLSSDEVRPQLERAASRLAALPVIQALVDKLKLGETVRIDQLLDEAVRTASAGDDLSPARCSFLVRSGPIAVPAKAGLLYGLMAHELARDVVADVEEGRHSIHVMLEATQTSRQEIELTVVVSGPPNSGCCANAREVVQTLAAALGGRVKGSEIPGGTLLFAQFKPALGSAF